MQEETYQLVMYMVYQAYREEISMADHVVVHSTDDIRVVFGDGIEK